MRSEKDNFDVIGSSICFAFIYCQDSKKGIIYRVDLEKTLKSRVNERGYLKGEDMKDSFFVLLLLVYAGINIKAASINHEEVFTTIYNAAHWGKNDQGEGYSGWGSELKYCKSYIEFLEKFVQRYGVKTIIDAGCGDWEFSRYVNWQGATYVGYDVVSHIINKNIALFAKDTISFVHANFLTEDLPPADLLLCKHVLQHLPNKDIMSFLKQLPKFKYCLMTNQVNPATLSSDNADIAVGDTHDIDLSKPPFNLKGVKTFKFYIEGTAHQVFFIDNSSDVE